MATERVSWKELGGMVALMVLVLLLWDSIVIFPLKIIVIFFHELSHGIAALVTGGSIQRISISSREGGDCLTLGGSPFLILSAGYLGSLLWGGVFLLLGARTKSDRPALATLGLMLVWISFLIVRPFESFGFIFGVSTGAVMIAIAVSLPAAVSDLLLRLVGLTSCLYAVFDIKSDILDRPGAESDASMLAAQTGIPVVIWGILWAAVAVVGAFFFLAISCRKEAPTPHKS